MARSRSHSFKISSLAALIALFAACGGGDGGGGTNPPPPPPPNNTPASITLSQTGALSVVSGVTATVSAQVLASDGRVLSGQTVTWASSNAAVASVSGGVITGVLVGTASITAAVGTVTSPAITVTVTPGAATQLSVKTQPGGAQVAVAFSSQPVVEIRDAAGNLVTASALTIAASIGSGTGTLTGLTNVAAVAGVAAFSNLSMTGQAGSRTLSFAASGLPSASSAPFVLAPGLPSQSLLIQQPIGGAIGAPLIQPAIVELRDISGNVATTSTSAVTATVVSGSGVITAGGQKTTVNGRATFNDLRITGTTGLYRLGFSATGVAAALLADPFALIPILYGFPGEKILLVNAGQNVLPPLSAGQAPLFQSSAPARVTVDNTGRLLAIAEGQAWVSASVPAGGDSVLVIVPRTMDGPVFATGLGDYTLFGAQTDIELVVYPRGTAVGSFSVLIGLNTQDFTASFTPFTRNIPGGQVAAVQLEGGLLRYSVATTTPITVPTSFGRVTLLNGPPGSRLSITISALDATAPDGTDVFPFITSTFLPLIFR